MDVTEGVTAYTIMLDDVYIGRLEFGPVITVDVRSSHPQLVEVMGQMISNPVYHMGRPITVGMPEYPQAVMGKLDALGYAYEKL